MITIVQTTPYCHSRAPLSHRDKTERDIKILCFFTFTVRSHSVTLVYVLFYILLYFITVDVEKSIEDVQKYTYDQTNDEYRNSECKDKIWNTISCTLQVEGKHLPYY